ncbi:hypothetical protein UMM65_00135 [Aureibaculum sp. 2210JD6-5]|uniref:hypothetical protein n=1 Tax=Aureibaculum sp. 2210JD6-5 TaxID=3103957 RepID=UPI002AAD7E9B|nr:hypothetical protein [Aureibaculum sp. 2210JD6-5]MDY7393637.1 hypothetical protein [Aureibaculum sp. 2210JD6-5]
MDNNTQQNSVFKTIQLIYGALIAGIAVFTIVVFTLVENMTYSLDVNDIFTIVVPITAVGGVLLSNFLYKSFINKISSNDSLSLKLAQYQTATLIKGACLEGSALLAVVATFLTNNITFLLVSLLLIVIMYLKFPKKEKFKEEVKLTFEEKSEFDRL